MFIISPTYVYLLSEFHTFHKVSLPLQNEHYRQKSTATMSGRRDPVALVTFLCRNNLCGQFQHQDLFSLFFIICKCTNKKINQTSNTINRISLLVTFSLKLICQLLLCPSAIIFLPSEESSDQTVFLGSCDNPVCVF